MVCESVFFANTSLAPTEIPQEAVAAMVAEVITPTGRREFHFLTFHPFSQRKTQSRDSDFQSPPWRGARISGQLANPAASTWRFYLRNAWPSKADRKPWRALQNPLVQRGLQSKLQRVIIKRHKVVSIQVRSTREFGGTTKRITLEFAGEPLGLWGCWSR
jgi:hypothetical protein